MKKKRMNFMMRYTSTVLAFILLCLAILQTHAGNAYASQQVQAQQVQQTQQNELTDKAITDQGVSQSSLKRNKRVAPAVVWAGWVVKDTGDTIKNTSNLRSWAKKMDGNKNILMVALKCGGQKIPMEYLVGD